MSGKTRTTVKGDKIYMGIQSDHLENLDKIGWKCVEVHELISILAQNPPMVPIFIHDEDDNETKVMNDVRTDNSGSAPVIIISVSKTPKPMTISNESYEEQIDHKRELGRQLGGMT